MIKKALVVLSGGQDSFTCFGLARDLYPSIEAISFHYGQRHGIELACAQGLCQRYKVPHKLVALPFVKGLVTSALVGDGDVGKPHPHNPQLPSSFVPARNALFLTIAHAHAQEIGATHIIAGMCQTDYSGYPDCREVFIDALASALNLGYAVDIKIVTPLMHMTKAETFALAERVGFLGEVLDHSHTCYNGNREIKHAWGYGCGHCPACDLRAKGWREYLDAKQQEVGV